MKLFLLFFCLATSTFLLAQEKVIKNEWPFYFFGPLAPWESKELLDHKTAQAKICKHIPSNCKLVKAKYDYNGEEYKISIIELKADPTKTSALSGLLILYTLEHASRGENNWKLALDPEIEKSFILDIKGQRIPLTDYNSLDPMMYESSYYRVQNVIPEPVSGEEKDYWLSFSHPNSKAPKLWFHMNTYVYDLKYGRINFSKSENDKTDKKASLDNLKSIIPDIETKLKGKRFGHYSIERLEFRPFYITGFDGKFLHLQVEYLANPVRFFEILKPPGKSIAIIQTPETEPDKSVGYDPSKHSEAYNRLERPCGDFYSGYWITREGEKKYPPLVFKIKPEDLMDGNKFKSFVGIGGPSAPMDWYLEGDYEWQIILSWRGNLETMSEAEFKKRVLQAFESANPEIKKYIKKFKSKKHIMSMSEKEYRELMNEAIKVVSYGYVEYQKMMKERYFMRDLTDEQYFSLVKHSMELKKEYCEKNQNKKK